MKSKLFLLAALALISCGKTKTTDQDHTKTDTTQVVANKDETLCFELKEKVDISENQKGDGEFMDVTTSVQITTKGDQVTGTIAEERLIGRSNVDAASGDLKGIRKGDTLIVDYTFSIEGSTQIEEVIYLLQGEKLSEKEGELIEKNGKMVLKNPSKASFGKAYTKVVCK